MANMHEDENNQTLCRHSETWMSRKGNCTQSQTITVTVTNWFVTYLAVIKSRNFQITVTVANWLVSYLVVIDRHNFQITVTEANWLVNYLAVIKSHYFLITVTVANCPC